MSEYIGFGHGDEEMGITPDSTEASAENSEISKDAKKSMAVFISQLGNAYEQKNPNDPKVEGCKNIFDSIIRPSLLSTEQIESARKTYEMLIAENVSKKEGETRLFREINSDSDVQLLKDIEPLMSDIEERAERKEFIL